MAGLSFRGLQPGAIDSDKSVSSCKWLASSIQFSVFSIQNDWPAFAALRRGIFSLREKMVGVRGVEPRTLRLSSACSNQLSYTPIKVGGAEEIRTPDL